MSILQSLFEVELLKSLGSKMPKPLLYYGRKRSKSEGALFTQVVQIGDIQVKVPDTQTERATFLQVAKVLEQLDQAALESLELQDLGEVKSAFH